LLAWRPELGGDGAPVYAQIVAALASDIERGALTAGTRLPTQRALAEELGVGLGTVTRAYAEAEGRGLIEAVVGRGSFVAGVVAPQSDGPVDLSRNIAPIHPARASLRAAVATLARRADLPQRLDYAPEGGFEADRRAAATWLNATAHFPQADARRLIVTAGAQQAIATAIAAACRPGDALIVEPATFHGVRLAADRARLRLIPAAMDSEGVTPEALDRAAAESGAPAAYLQPFQNPTARVMSLQRRRDILEVARQRRIVIIEDDLYAPHVADLGLPPLAQLAPDQVAYVSGLTKSLAPGMRFGMLIMPDVLRAAALEALRAMTFGPPTLGAALATHWIESGEAFSILEAVRAELVRRTPLAATLLAGLVEPIRHKGATHLWLPLAELEAERVAGQALRAGALVTAPAAPFVPGVPVDGLRICLGAAADLAALERGLVAVREAVRPDRPLAGDVV
jgi:DNA-binding transcriptional MocR family regulator